MELPYLDFDSDLSTPYKKSASVLAFRTDDAVVFHKPWGRQTLPEGSWIIVPLERGRPTGDVYGCHPKAFVSTYKRAEGGQSNTFVKHAVVEAYQPGQPFAVKTVVDGYVEVNPATGGSSDWLVRNPGGETYIVTDVVFRATYRAAH